jgi:hypothetical protein
MNKKYIVYIAATFALASFGYWYYEKKRVEALNARVDTLQSALDKLNKI